MGTCVMREVRYGQDACTTDTQHRAVTGEKLLQLTSAFNDPVPAESGIAGLHTDCVP